MILVGKLDLRLSLHLVYYTTFFSPISNVLIVFYCSRYKREDSDQEFSINEESDDSAVAEELQQTRAKKHINKGRWSKEEVRHDGLKYHSTLCIKIHLFELIYIILTLPL